ncbi:phage tail assembly protein [Mesorhizobium sp. M00.F.Ca.ET.151.01.1.1]|nr:phage tail assembly protein [bacterium M00.F.Ca.ET.199.01.1.1]TGT02992.1 phage tail assembly protein [bacterium M00.F.Ca.ET.177.01.1.1]TGT57928.1 phage tail assembly protein [Mesorhizobium sp. M00.F.Ca.ET.170.01.1.1]TGU06841.1 phage tail assembly protein [bacterium M00.F.Ca.ET.163.01.1.1]TGU91542.1 phage tail assembly protein [Mesorhizobium sp. M00.F.Ca.ET.151.01.1.1]TGV53230.1 phage tail assembly protein [bacterium M00.F.Ca.ET.141.01.1.1]
MTAKTTTPTDAINAVDPSTITLDCPIQRGEQVITAVTLRKPNAGELRGIKLVELLQMDVSALATLLPRITLPTLTAADVNQLDPADLVAIGTLAAGFFVPKAQREFLTA